MSVLEPRARPGSASYMAEPLSGLRLPETGSPVQHLGREICGDFDALERREWLVTNGIGGYASASLSGMPTRGYHGLLVAAQKPPVGRTLLLTALVETLTANGADMSLATLRWRDGTVAPAGWLRLESVTFEGTIPTWRFAAPGLLLEKTLFMDRGVNTTRIEYTLRRADGPVHLRVEPLVTARDYHSRTFVPDLPDAVTAERGRMHVRRTGFDASDLYLVCDAADWRVELAAWSGIDLAAERARGLTDTEDTLRAGSTTVTLQPGETIQLTASASGPVPADPMARARALAREAEVVSQWQSTLAPTGGAFDAQGTSRGTAMQAPLRRQPADCPSAWAARLALAADQFVVHRTVGDGAQGHSIIAGYPWFADWGRDTMISLPGLTHACGRPEIAASLLRSFSQTIDKGMIPNRFPDDGAPPEFNTVDAAFWFIEAVAGQWRETGDTSFLAEIFPSMMAIVAAHEQGTRYGIGVAEDGLVHAGGPGVQLTWMDAKVGDWVVTPRRGKPIEVNALWASNLAFLAEVAPQVGQDPKPLVALRDRVRDAFHRFWNPETGYAFDVIDGPEGNDPTLRPNQIFAALGRAGVFDTDQRRAIVDVCQKNLLTPGGLRTLPYDHPDYVPIYSGDQCVRDAAYHRGTAWPWLLGPFAEAHLELHRDPCATWQAIAPLADQIGTAGLGTLGEIHDADAPHAPKGCIAQAWSVGELLRAWRLIRQAAPANS